MFTGIFIGHFDVAQATSMGEFKVNRGDGPMTPTIVTYFRLPLSLTFGLPTNFASYLFVYKLRALGTLFVGGVSRNTVNLIIVQK